MRCVRVLAYCFLAMYWHNVPIIENAVTADQTGRVCKISADVLLSRLYIIAGAYAKGGYYSEEFKTNVLDKYYVAFYDFIYVSIKRGELNRT